LAGKELSSQQFSVKAEESRLALVVVASASSWTFCSSLEKPQLTWYLGSRYWLEPRCC